ncbi:hypothetical protein PG993_004113 [Apiospora rasikravindrae]|uniref:Uncharacterized protein n=1 Tax=Apiospora rasikravindrae TaxID=990691 RepID=A0ABR1TE86_9PEZI
MADGGDIREGMGAMTPKGAGGGAGLLPFFEDGFGRGARALEELRIRLLLPEWLLLVGGPPFGFRRWSLFEVVLLFGCHGRGHGFALLDIREGLARPPPPRYPRGDWLVVFFFIVVVVVVIRRLGLRYRPGRAAAAGPAHARLLELVSVLHEVEALHPLVQTGLGFGWRVGHRPSPAAEVLLGARLPVCRGPDARIPLRTVLRPRPGPLPLPVLLLLILLAGRQCPRVLVLVPGGVPAVSRHHRFSFLGLLLVCLEHLGVALAPGRFRGLFGLVLVNVQE